MPSDDLAVCGVVVDHEDPLPGELRGSAPEAIVVGVRPEHLEVTGGGGTFAFTVDTIEALGADSLLHGQHAGAQLVARVSGHAAPLVGQALALTPKPGRVYFFDGATGKRLRPARS